MKKKAFLVGMVMVFYTGLGISQRPSPVRVESGLLQGTYENMLIVYID